MSMPPETPPPEVVASEPDCRICEDWGTVVSFAPNGQVNGINYCRCRKGVERRDVEQGQQERAAGS